MDNSLFYIIFILPGFFSFLIVKTLYKIGFAKKADVFDKTLYSLLFDIPIFLITIKLLNNKLINKLIANTKEMVEFKSITDFKMYFIKDISNLLNLILLISLISLLVGLCWILIIYIISLIFNKISSRKVFVYSNMWNEDFYKVKESIPIQVFKNNVGTPLLEGFLIKVSSSLDNDLELETYNVDLFKQCMSEGLINEVDKIYYNLTKDLKIIVYKLDAIDEYIKTNIKKNNWRENIWATTKKKVKAILS